MLIRSYAQVKEEILEFLKQKASLAIARRKILLEEAITALEKNNEHEPVVTALIQERDFYDAPESEQARIDWFLGYLPPQKESLNPRIPFDMTPAERAEMQQLITNEKLPITATNPIYHSGNTPGRQSRRKK